jgi:hypothetical protein
MIRNGYFNPLEFYSKIIKYNIESLNKLLRFNKSFFESVASRYNSGNQGLENYDSEAESDKMKLSTFMDTQLSKDILAVQHPELHPADNDVQALEELNIALMSNRPIRTLQNMNVETAEKLDLFGIHTMMDLTENDLALISQNTGIPMEELIDWKRQVQQYLP